MEFEFFLGQPELKMPKLASEVTLSVLKPQIDPTGHEGTASSDDGVGLFPPAYPAGQLPLGHPTPPSPQCLVTVSAW